MKIAKKILGFLILSPFLLMATVVALPFVILCWAYDQVMPEYMK